MSPVTRRVVGVTAVVALVALGVFGLLPWVAGDGDGSEGAASASAQEVRAAIIPSGERTVLSPGGAGMIQVEVENSGDVPVIATAISAGQSLPTGPGGVCAAGSVWTAPKPFPRPVVVAPHGRATYTLLASMVADPDDGCQGEIFKLPLTVSFAAVPE